MKSVHSGKANLFTMPAFFVGEGGAAESWLGAAWAPQKDRQMVNGL
jgi:hypothetical protein